MDMEIEAEPAALVASGEVDEVIEDEVPRPVDPITAMMGVLWKVGDFYTKQLRTGETEMRRRGGNYRMIDRPWQH